MANVDDTTLQACLHTSEPASLYVGRVSYSNRKTPEDEGGKASSFQEKKTLIHSETLFEEAGHWLPSLASRFDTSLVLPRSGQSWSFWPSFVEVMHADSRGLPPPPFVCLEPSLCLSTSHASFPLILTANGPGPAVLLLQMGTDTAEMVGCAPGNKCREGRLSVRTNAASLASQPSLQRAGYSTRPFQNSLCRAVKLRCLVTMSRRHVPFLPEGHVPQKNKTNKTSTTKATF